MTSHLNDDSMVISGESGDGIIVDDEDKDEVSLRLFYINRCSEMPSFMRFLIQDVLCKKKKRK